MQASSQDSIDESLLTEVIELCVRFNETSRHGRAQKETGRWAKLLSSYSKQTVSSAVDVACRQERISNSK